MYTLKVPIPLNKLTFGKEMVKRFEYKQLFWGPIHTDKTLQSFFVDTQGYIKKIHRDLYCTQSWNTLSTIFLVFFSVRIISFPPASSHFIL